MHTKSSNGTKQDAGTSHVIENTPRWNKYRPEISYGHAVYPGGILHVPPDSAAAAVQQLRATYLLTLIRPDSTVPR